jgi:hypothetical protein
MSGCSDFNPRLQHGAFGVGFAGAHGPGPGSRTVAEHLSCSLMLLGFLPMHSGSQQCVNVASCQVTFTAITRVQIPSGTPIISATYALQ